MTEPLAANSWARLSPIGKIPISKPWIKIAKPMATMIRPSAIEFKSGGTCCKINIWKKEITKIIGRRSLNEFNKSIKACLRLSLA